MRTGNVSYRHPESIQEQPVGSSSTRRTQWIRNRCIMYPLCPSGCCLHHHHPYPLAPLQTAVARIKCQPIRSSIIQKGSICTHSPAPTAGLLGIWRALGLNQVVSFIFHDLPSWSFPVAWKNSKNKLRFNFLVLYLQIPRPTMDILKSPVGSHHNSGSGGGGGGGSGYPEAAFEDGLLDLGVPVQVQSFLWRQIAPFIRPKLGKLHEASCMVSGPPVPHGSRGRPWPQQLWSS